MRERSGVGQVLGLVVTSLLSTPLMMTQVYNNNNINNNKDTPP